MCSVPIKGCRHCPKTGGLAAEVAERAVSHIIASYTALRNEESLAPAKTVNATLSSLVKLCSKIHDQETVDMILQDTRLKPVLPELRRLCAESEFLLECHWAAWVQNQEDSHMSPGVWDRLHSFPYYNNYVELVRIELAALFTVMPSAPARMAYIGAGPMPLTSICVMQAISGGSSPWGAQKGVSGLKILNIDCDEKAVETSRTMAQKLGLPEEGMSFLQMDARDPRLSLSGYQVVYLAALVGCTHQEKEKCLANIASRMDPGAVILTRSAWGLRKCLYPELQINTPALLKWLEVCLVVHPYGAVVNSVVVAKVRARDTW